MASKNLQTLFNGFKKNGLVNRILVTGGCGSFGSDLYPRLKQVYGEENILVTDIHNNIRVPDQFFKHLDVTNKNAVDEVTGHFKPDTIIHLAGLSPAKCEEDSAAAIKVNAEGSRNVIEVATERTLKIFSASTVASYGSFSGRRNVPDLAVQRPETMQGITKFYCELMGNYHRKRYGTDFRAIRYPIVVTPNYLAGKVNSGIIELFRDAHKKKTHKSFLRPDKLLPAIYIDDAVFALLQLLEAPKENLKENTFNISGCSFTPESQVEAIRKHFPDFKVKFVEEERTKFFDTWPETLNDSQARDQWGFDPRYGLEEITQFMLTRGTKKTQTEK